MELDANTYAATLVRCLACWDPRGDASIQDARAKQGFIDALTEISALPADALDMEVRRLVVDGAGAGSSKEAAHLTHLVAALSHRDVLLKCKVANAVGSLCTSRVAGQRLLELHGAELLSSLSRMAASKNTWAQADAFFVFGWVVVIGEDALVAQQLARFIATAVKLLARNFAKPAFQLNEQDGNLRIYCLVFLLNFSQRDVNALKSELMNVLETLQLVVSRLLETTASMIQDETGEVGDDDGASSEALAEHMEIVRLTITLLHTLLEQMKAAPAMVLALKMLSELLKLEQVLQSQVLSQKLRRLRTTGRSSGDEAGKKADEEGLEHNGGGSEELAELRERMRSIKELVLACR